MIDGIHIELSAMLAELTTLVQSTKNASAPSTSRFASLEDLEAFLVTETVAVPEAEKGPAGPAPPVLSPMAVHAQNLAAETAEDEAWLFRLLVADLELIVDDVRRRSSLLDGGWQYLFGALARRLAGHLNALQRLMT